MRFQKFTSVLLCALVALAGLSLEVQAVKSPVKGDPFVGLSHIQRPDESRAIFMAIENQPGELKPFNGPHITKVVVREDGSFAREWLFTGLPDTEFVSLAVSGEIAFVTTTNGEVIVANLDTAESATYHGLIPGIRYGLILDDPSLQEVGVYDTSDPLRLVHYLNRGAARYMRTEAPEEVAAGCSTIMALGLRRVWDLHFRSSSGSTRRYLVVDSGNSGLAPRLLQVSYDFSSMASSVTVIATGAIGENWYGGDYVSPYFYFGTRAGEIKKVDVNTGAPTLVSSTGGDLSFYSDLVVRSGQAYSVGYNGRIKKTNVSTGVTTLLVQLPGSAHSIALDSGGNSLVVTGSLYNGGFRAALWKVTLGGSVTLFAQGPANGSFSFYGVVNRGSNNYDVINNMIGGVIRVNSFSGPWTVVCPSSGGQNQELIRDNSRNILGDYTQGSIQYF